MSLTHTLVGKDGFRLRGTEMSRVDGFSDVVFGFALTLIVASLEVPKTYGELHEVLLGFVPFAICFVFLMLVWLSHFRFFRRFGLHDTGTVIINAGLLFTVLFYVYPLKFLFTLVGAQFYQHHAKEPAFSNMLQVRELVVVYGLGFAAIYLFLTLLNLHAWRLRHALALNPLELTLLKAESLDLGFCCLTGLAVALVGRLLPPEHALAACYLFLAIAGWRIGSRSYFGRRAQRIRNQMAAQPTAQPQMS